MNPPLRAGVMGWPISHSLSPVLHGHWLKRYGIDGTYEAYAVRPEELADALALLRAEKRRGTNLTVPHKEAAMSLVDEIDDTARRIGAVNTLVLRESGILSATNTDAFGLVENIRGIEPGAVANKFNGRPVVILGAGGAARAALVGLADLGVRDIRIVNRTRSRAEALIGIVSDMNVSVVAIAEDDRAAALPEAGLLVNTTTLGMEGQPPLDLDLTGLPRDAIVNDIVYAPLETGLLASARERGNPVVDGLGMLLHQARAGFREWFGVDPEVDDALRAAVLAARR
ncbi:MAG: shikimate dehydrogenase [Alphaproteobacteria bacterium]|nr:shikimate dehydrogenase [Alphaproteobacteria bacterium]